MSEAEIELKRQHDYIVQLEEEIAELKEHAAVHGCECKHIQDD